MIVKAFHRKWVTNCLLSRFYSIDMIERVVGERAVQQLVDTYDRPNLIV